MAASSRSGVSRKIWALAAAIVLVIAVYTGGWFYAAFTLKEKTLAMLGAQQARGLNAECADAEYRGYPFRIGLFCSRVSIDDHQNGVAATFGSLRSAAQIYQPNHIIWEIDGPAETRTGHGLSISSQWTTLQSSLIAKIGGVERSSTVIEGLVSNIVSSQTGQAFDLKIRHTEAHMRQNGDNLDAAVTLQDTDLMGKGLAQLIPKFTAAADVTLIGKAGLLEGRNETGTGFYNSQGEIRRISVDLGDGQVVSISGPVSIDEQGRLSGKLKVQVEKIAAWRDRLKTAMPQIASTIDTAAKMLSALTGGGDRASLDLTINRGKVMAGGFIPLGQIPPI